MYHIASVYCIARAICIERVCECRFSWRSKGIWGTYCSVRRRKGGHLSVCVETRARSEGIYMGDKEEGGVTCPSAWRQGLRQRGYIWETKRKGGHLSVCVETRARTEGIYMGDK